MIREHGPDGARLWRLSHGIDDRRVSPERETKSISAETTFEIDVSDREELQRVLLSLCERVALRLKRQELAAKSVTLKLRLPDFKTPHAHALQRRADATGDTALRDRARFRSGALADGRQLSALSASPPPISPPPRRLDKARPRGQGHRPRESARAGDRRVAREVWRRGRGQGHGRGEDVRPAH